MLRRTSSNTHRKKWWQLRPVSLPPPPPPPTTRILRLRSNDTRFCSAAAHWLWRTDVWLTWLFGADDVTESNISTRPPLWTSLLQDLRPGHHCSRGHCSGYHYPRDPCSGQLASVRTPLLRDLCFRQHVPPILRSTVSIGRPDPQRCLFWHRVSV